MSGYPMLQKQVLEIKAVWGNKRLLNTTKDYQRVINWTKDYRRVVKCNSGLMKVCWV